MNIAVIGGGGREHAIIKKIKENPDVKNIYALPGNGGISYDAQCVPIGAKDIDAIVDFAVEKKLDFVVVAPDDPLALGAVDALHGAGIACFGPERRAAEIESSKVFAKDFMKKYGIPTAAHEVFGSAAAAIEYLVTAKYPSVIKADGLAVGKGVFIVGNYDEALSAVKQIMTDRVFGASGSRIVIEEYLEGNEVTVLSFTDGNTIVPMLSSMDHKRALDGDRGNNTGGMGTVAPNPFYTKELAHECMKKIFLPTINGMNEEGRKFKGCLYFGLILTGEGPKVIEYNARFGDPETQAVLPLLETDLLSVMLAVENEKLSEIDIRFSGKSACCVIAASGGYPESYKTGFPISFNNTDARKDVIIYHAGTKREGDELLTNGGRVLGVTGIGETLSGAMEKAYAAVKEIEFKDMYFRSDIGKRAVEKINN